VECWAPLGHACPVNSRMRLLGGSHQDLWWSAWNFGTKVMTVFLEHHHRTSLTSKKGIPSGLPAILMELQITDWQSSDEQSTINATDNAFTNIQILPAHLTTLRHLTKLGKHHVHGLAAALASYSQRDWVRPFTLFMLHSTVMAAARCCEIHEVLVAWNGCEVWPRACQRWCCKQDEAQHGRHLH